jgi:hypothetical protein
MERAQIFALQSDFGAVSICRVARFVVSGVKAMTNADHR